MCSGVFRNGWVCTPIHACFCNKFVFVAEQGTLYGSQSQGCHCLFNCFLKQCIYGIVSGYIILLGHDLFEQRNNTVPSARHALFLILVMSYTRVVHLLPLCGLLLAEAGGNTHATRAPKAWENQCANSQSRTSKYWIQVRCLRCHWLFADRFVVPFEPTACGLQDTHREAQSMRRWSTAGGTAAHQDLEHWQGKAHTAEHVHQKSRERYKLTCRPVAGTYSDVAVWPKM